MEYEVVAESSLDNLLKEVRRLIGEGFKPTGGVSNIRGETDGTHYCYFYQAMIKLDEI